MPPAITRTSTPPIQNSTDSPPPPLTRQPSNSLKIILEETPENRPSLPRTVYDHSSDASSAESMSPYGISMPKRLSVASSVASIASSRSVPEDEDDADLEPEPVPVTEQQVSHQPLDSHTDPLSSIQSMFRAATFRRLTTAEIDKLQKMNIPGLSCKIPFRPFLKAKWLSRFYRSQIFGISFMVFMLLWLIAVLIMRITHPALTIIVSVPQLFFVLSVLTGIDKNAFRITLTHFEWYYLTLHCALLVVAGTMSLSQGVEAWDPLALMIPFACVGIACSFGTHIYAVIRFMIML
jgi:hypothetical protein